MFKLSKKSLAKLNEVNPDLQKLVKNAIGLSTIDFGISPTDIGSQSEQFRMGDCVPRSQNIKEMVHGIGDKGRPVRIVKKELGICEDNLNYLRKWGYIDISTGGVS